MNQLLEYDRALFLFLNHLGSETWDGFWLLVTNKYASIPLYIILFFLCIKKFGIRSTVITIVMVALLITATDQLANLFKQGFERLRPCHDEEVMNNMRLVTRRCGGKFGYFSAHAANAFATATFFSLLLAKQGKGLSLVLTLWAIFVSYSRIYVGVHYPLDVITGITIGMLIGWLFFIIRVRMNRSIKI